MTAHLCEVWPGPPSGVEPIDAVEEVVGAEEAGSLPYVEWTMAELIEFAESTADLTLGFLDHVARHKAGELFLGSDLEESGSGYAGGQISGVTGAMAKKTYQHYRRINPPVEFVQVDGRWSWPPSAATPPPAPHRGTCSWRGRASGARTGPPPSPDTAAASTTVRSSPRTPSR
ncbi:hypothetical protein ACFQ07_05150, partial [Actinomadura adrarensis]